MIDDGYIKFNCDWQNEAIGMPSELFQKINTWRKKLHDLKLIGIYADGIGFGNVSCKNTKDDFFITGSATGNKKDLSIEDYAQVTEWNFNQNFLKCRGNTKASSESLSHAAIYESDAAVNAVIHVHSIKMWKKYINILPTTNSDIKYGTPEMAFAIKKLVQDRDPNDPNILIMGGHEEGIITYGQSIDEAGEVLLEYFTNI